MEATSASGGDVIETQSNYGIQTGAQNSQRGVKQKQPESAKKYDLNKQITEQTQLTLIELTNKQT